ncbi:hypothetical protein C3747_29g103 [Trypanosoma cruzi]|uniref:Uncharacterized protein n=1 Tax=Trypanosoma cruzi TaxID=5693 RepID=A0A2V2X5U9_TRYCR|nr:hypothetical protein ECC02_002528 [Trypanosoma cruzi]KAF8295810.1 hypothetical protein TcYC6_0090100 [Trypanosoma cruzi]PWV15503.1 hypothetical protein C3747_29g103 [Trypanosoma cruzi]
MSKVVPLPGITFAGASYACNERVFESLPKNDKRRIRRGEVIRFRGAPRPFERPRWNISVLDEAHPFPQPPIMHSLHTFEGVEVLHREFPEIVHGAKHLETKCRPGPWTMRVKKGSPRDVDSAGERWNSYLSRVIASDWSERKKELRSGWDSSTKSWTFTGRIGDPKESQRSHVELNKTKKILNMDTYNSPLSRVKKINESIRAAKRNEKMRREQTSPTHVCASGAPAVFKMSNIDEWWHLDPTLTAAETTAASAVNVNEGSEE